MDSPEVAVADACGGDNMWVAKYHLRNSDKELVVSNACLDDRIIDAVNRIINTYGIRAGNSRQHFCR